jgi:lysozyme
MNRFAEMIITLDEGWKNVPYHCSEGYPTIGYGRKLSDVKFGRLPTMTVTKQDEIVFVRNKINEITFQLQSRFPVQWNICSAQRQAVLISMAYQLGTAGLSEFRNMWAAIQHRDFDKAAAEMLNSKWAKQTPNRVNRYVEIMKRGDMTQYYLTNGAMS